MATHVVSRRIQYIIQYINDFKYPSKNQIIDFLIEKDFKVSARTLERDIERIRSDFGLEISYSKEYNGYFIDREKSVKVESFFKFLEIVTLADIFTNSLKDSHKLFDYVSFDDSKYLKGIENIKDILIAINQNQKIKFIHENFEANTFKKYDLTPFLLKEYENRWYVIGVPEGLNEIRTFGIDRITKLSIGKISKLNKKAFSKQFNNFENIVGLNYDDGNPIKISLLVDAIHIKYMESLPLHHSQIILPGNSENKYQVNFFLVPNYEFITQILKMGDQVEVVYPKSLRLEIKKILNNSLKKYL